MGARNDWRVGVHVSGTAGSSRVAAGAAPDRARALRPWLAPLAVALVAVSLAPPVGTLARSYVFVETIQFTLFAVAVPALIVLGAPWRFLRLSRAGRRPSATDRAGGGPADRLAVARAQRPAFLRSGGFLLAFLAVAIAWRLPPLVDALARTPGLAAVEMATLLPAGVTLWLEVVDSPPLRPRRPGPQRAALSAVAMWVLWIAAYVLGASSDVVYGGAFHHVAGGLGGFADQELAAGVLWLVPGLAFIPIVFAAGLGWLKAIESPDEELARAAGGEIRTAGVRGWNRSSRSGKAPSR